MKKSRLFVFAFSSFESLSKSVSNCKAILGDPEADNRDKEKVETGGSYFSSLLFVAEFFPRPFRTFSNPLHLPLGFRGPQARNKINRDITFWQLYSKFCGIRLYATEVRITELLLPLSRAYCKKNISLQSMTQRWNATLLSVVPRGRWLLVAPKGKTRKTLGDRTFSETAPKE